MKIRLDFPHHKRLTAWVVVAILVSVTLISSTMPATYFMFGVEAHIKLVAIISCFAMNTSRLYITFQFFIATYFLRKRFHALNLSLRSFSLNKSSMCVHGSSISRNYGHLYHILYDSIELLNETFTTQFIYLLSNVLVSEISFRRKNISSPFMIHRFQVQSVFAAFGFIHGLLDSDGLYPLIIILLNCQTLVFTFFLATVIVYAGSSLIKEAETPNIIIAQLMIEHQQNHSQTIDFLYFDAQLRSRNTKVKNKLFIIDWKLLLMVSEERISIVNNNEVLSVIVSDDINCYHVPGDHVSVQLFIKLMPFMNI